MSVLVPFEYILLDNNGLAVRTESVIYILRYLRQFNRTFRIVEIIVRQIADVFNFLSYQSAFSVNWIPLLVNLRTVNLLLSLLLGNALLLCLPFGFNTSFFLRLFCCNPLRLFLLCLNASLLLRLGTFTLLSGFPFRLRLLGRYALRFRFGGFLTA